MKRLAQLILIVTVAAAATDTAFAQQQRPMAVQGVVGATFGNKTSATFGGEFDYKVGTEWEVFVELGQMRNVAPSQMDGDANAVAGAIGGSAKAAERATFYAGGVKYLFPPTGGGIEPYIGVGFGAASVKKDVTFSVDGAELSEADLLAQYGVQLGADLAGSTTKPLFLVAFGVTRPFAGRLFLDASYRYGLIFAKSGSIEDDKGLHTQRLQLGVGVRF